MTSRVASLSGLVIWVSSMLKPTERIAGRDDRNQFATIFRPSKRNGFSGVANPSLWVPFRVLRLSRPSFFMCPIIGSIALRRQPGNHISIQPDVFEKPLQRR